MSVPGPTRQRTVARSTGTEVVVEDTRHPLADCGYEAGLRWATICWGRSTGAHNGVATHPTLALARTHAAAPEEWCEECMAEQDDREEHDCG